MFLRLGAWRSRPIRSLSTCTPGGRTWQDISRVSIYAISRRATILHTVLLSALLAQLFRMYFYLLAFPAPPPLLLLWGGGWSRVTDVIDEVCAWMTESLFFVGGDTGGSELLRSDMSASKLQSETLAALEVSCFFDE